MFPFWSSEVKLEEMRRTYAVPEPVRGGGQTNTTRSDWEREDLADDNPSSWTPGGGEK